MSSKTAYIFWALSGWLAEYTWTRQILEQRLSLNNFLALCHAVGPSNLLKDVACCVLDTDYVVYLLSFQMCFHGKLREGMTRHFFLTETDLWLLYLPGLSVCMFVMAEATGRREGKTLVIPDLCLVADEVYKITEWWKGNMKFFFVFGALYNPTPNSMIGLTPRAVSR